MVWARVSDARGISVASRRLSSSVITTFAKQEIDCCSVSTWAMTRACDENRESAVTNDSRSVIRGVLLPSLHKSLLVAYGVLGQTNAEKDVRR